MKSLKFGVAALSIGFVLLSMQQAQAITTVTRYMAQTNRTTEYNEGCSQAKALVSGTGNSWVVILDYGQPAISGSTQGLYVFNNVNFQSLATITTAVEGYLDGFAACTVPGYNGFMRVAVGTSNKANGNASNVTTAHAKAFAAMINTLSAYVTSKGYQNKEGIRAASDMEPDWNSPSTTRAWLDAYSSVTSTYIYNYGDAAGCPSSGQGSGAGACEYPWTQEDIYYISWGNKDAYVIPEIYGSDWYSGQSQAWQWQQLSLYGKLAHGAPIQILGELTQHEACRLTPPPNCLPTNYPADGWNQLQNALNSDSRTAYALQYSTDITWAQ